jgi:hypothetical protein
VIIRCIVSKSALKYSRYLSSSFVRLFLFFQLVILLPHCETSLPITELPPEAFLLFCWFIFFFISTFIYRSLAVKVLYCRVSGIRKHAVRTLPIYFTLLPVYFTLISFLRYGRYRSNDKRKSGVLIAF